MYGPRRKTHEDLVDEMLLNDFKVPPVLYQLENYKSYRNVVGLAAIRNQIDQPKKPNEDKLAKV